MLSLFKSKPKLAELIPSGYVDIHSHVLPGIDDGAQKIKDAEFLLESMIDFGFSKVITTPHTMKNVWDNTTETIKNAHHLVQDELPELSKKVALNCASEYFLDENLMQLAQRENLLTLKDNFILIEMSYLNAPIQLYDFLFELQLKGYQLVLAHPERYNYFHSNKKEFAKLKKAGCLFQLNLLSTTGYYGESVAKTAQKLLENNMIDFVGSDVHHLNHVESFENRIIIKEESHLIQAIQNNQLFL
mgnify:CR=1 FL=1